MATQNYTAELWAAITAIQRAAKISRHVLLATDKGQIQKDDLSPVTVADFAIQALLTRHLRYAFPEDGFIAEESADQLRDDVNLRQHVDDVIQQCDDDALPAASQPDLCDLIDLGSKPTPIGPDTGRVWVFDPIDGTKTFIRGEQYAINVALIEDGIQVLSVVALPLLSMDAQAPLGNADIDPTGPEGGCILYAVRGLGARVIPLSFLGKDHGEAGRSLPRHCDAVTPESLSSGEEAATLRSVTCWNSLDSGVDDVHKAATESLGVPFPGCDLLGWVPRWSVLALGLANMTIWVYKRRDRCAKIWDHAGAMLLFEEVGGKITDVHGNDIDLTRGRKLEANFGFVAAPKSVHHIVLKAVQETLKQQGKRGLLI
ncbi:hypothetical protein B0T17DRAFT_498372 [Bombardia bombarda]|uniref:3'(2'),5'-bisphosphate nucleotidase n=1 Tax=Bombardia bombarda TaxID=252184 RepID=A0AA39WG93_9PEZI|nr:hypothetical protein B0T17DRAFT_498372 [Bombardia bombarda]